MPAPQAAITATRLSFKGWHRLQGRGHKTDCQNLPEEVKPQSEYGDGKEHLLVQQKSRKSNQTKEFFGPYVPT